MISSMTEYKKEHFKESVRSNQLSEKRHEQNFMQTFFEVKWQRLYSMTSYDINGQDQKPYRFLYQNCLKLQKMLINTIIIN